MKDSTQKALDRAIQAMERSARRPRRRGSTAWVVVGLAYALGYHLLVRLVPRVWATTLPGGLEQANNFRGWPGLVWGLANAAAWNFGPVVVAGVVLVLLAYLVSRLPWPLRWGAWVMAVGAIVVDAGILVVTLRTATAATAAAAGIGL